MRSVHRLGHAAVAAIVLLALTGADTAVEPPSNF